MILDINPHSVEDTILTTLDSFHQAMIDRHIETLDEIVSPDYFLVHISGYQQGKEEWFHMLKNRAFDYHSIDILQDSLTLTLNSQSDRANVLGQGIFNATINGYHALWRLDFSMTFILSSQGWQIENSHYGTF